MLPAPNLPATPPSASRRARGRHAPGRHAAGRSRSATRHLLLPGLLVATGGAALLGVAELPTPSEASEVRPAPAAVQAAPAVAALWAPVASPPTAPVASPLAAPAPVAAAAPVAAPVDPLPEERAVADRVREVEQARASRSRREALPAYVRPVPGPISSTFGPRWGRLHAGIDFAIPVGTPVKAIAAGVVELASYDAGGYGHHVVVRHADGRRSLYAHLSTVRELGERVVAGQVLGRSGNTGQSTGPHLHFEMRGKNGPFDPVPWLAAHGLEL